MVLLMRSGLLWFDTNVILFYYSDVHMFTMSIKRKKKKKTSTTLTLTNTQLTIWIMSQITNFLLKVRNECWGQSGQKVLSVQKTLSQFHCVQLYGTWENSICWWSPCYMAETSRKSTEQLKNKHWHTTCHGNNSFICTRKLLQMHIDPSNNDINGTSLCWCASLSDGLVVELLISKIFDLSYKIILNKDLPRTRSSQHNFY